MNYTIRINANNSAFEEPSQTEVARILRSIADKIEEHPPVVGFDQPIFDINGNKVGNTLVQAGAPQ